MSPASRQRGQGLVEFALVLTPLLLILMGIIQFGFIFNTYVTLTNAVREGARSGSIYVYDRLQTKDVNDLGRNETVKTVVLNSMNFLSKTAPQFATGAIWSQSGTTYTNGDLTIEYTLPADIQESDPRAGQELRVQAVYHQDLIVPLIAALLPRDAGGRLVMSAQVTMVIN